MPSRRTSSRRRRRRRERFFVIGAVVALCVAIPVVHFTLRNIDEGNVPKRGSSLSEEGGILEVMAGSDEYTFLADTLESTEHPDRRRLLNAMMNGDRQTAMTILERIVKNSAEENALRAAALLTIHRLDPGKGKQLAQRYSRTAQGDLRNAADRIMKR